MNRIEPLRRFMIAIHSYFVAMNGNSLAEQEHRMWRVMRRLYGPERFPLGGSIVNEKQIYELARSTELTLLTEEAQQLAHKLKHKSNQIEHLMEDCITTNKLI